MYGDRDPSQGAPAGCFVYLALVGAILLPPLWVFAAFSGVSSEPLTNFGELIVIGHWVALLLTLVAAVTAGIEGRRNRRWSILIVCALMLLPALYLAAQFVLALSETQ